MPENSHSRDWSEYWKHGSLTTFFEGEFQVGYSGEVAEFWEKQFSALAPKATIVDLATGNGAIPYIAAQVNAREKKEFRIIGIDYAEIRLPNAQDVQLQMNDVELLPNRPMEQTGLENNVADLITSHFGFEYGDQSSVLDEIERLLRPGGSLALVMHHPDSAVVQQAKRDYRQTRMCIQEERLDRKVRDLVKIVGDARTPEQRAQLKNSKDAEKLRNQINRTMQRLLKRVEGEDNKQLIQVAQSFLRVFADLVGQSKEKKIEFIRESSQAFLAYAGRMEAMARATLDEQQFTGLTDTLSDRKFKILSNANLHSKDDKFIGRSLTAVYSY